MLDKKVRIRRIRIHLGEVLGKKVVEKEDYFLPQQIKHFVRYQYMFSTSLVEECTLIMGNVVCVNPFTKPKFLKSL